MLRVVWAGAAAGMFVSATAIAAPSLSRPGQDIPRAEQPRAEASLETEEPAREAAEEVRFTIEGVRLDAQELRLNKEALAAILGESVGKETTLSAFRATIDKVTAYCRAHGYPAAAAYLPAQESADGTVTIKVIPGRYGKVRIDNKSRLREPVIEGFLKNMEPGKIIRTAELETALYSISELAGTRAIGVLSPGEGFGTSDVTVRVEGGKESSTVLYAENYGSRSSGRYRYGVQESLYNVDGAGGRASVGGLLSNDHLHNYYANYEMLAGRGGTKLGIGISRMDYTLGRNFSSLGAHGTAETVSLFGRRPLYHLSDAKLDVRFGYDYRRLKDEYDGVWSALNRRKHSHGVHVGLDGYNRYPGAALEYGLTVTTGRLGADSDFAQAMNEAAGTDGRFTKAEASLTGVVSLGHQTDVMLKASGQAAADNLDSSEEMYLGGANGVRAYPQGEGSGDEGILGTMELRWHTDVPGLTLSAYLDGGHTRTSHRAVGGYNSTQTLKGWGVGVSYTKPNDWFARFDWARRIGGYASMSEEAKARNRLWFILGKVW